MDITGKMQRPSLRPDWSVIPVGLWDKVSIRVCPETLVDGLLMPPDRRELCQGVPPMIRVKYTEIATNLTILRTDG